VKNANEGRALVIGFPSFYAGALVETLVKKTSRRISFLCPHRLIPSATIWSEHFKRRRKKIEILEGEPHHVDFGLSGSEWNKLKDETEIVYHFYPPGNPRSNVRKALVETLELCESAPGFKRLVFLSLLGGESRDTVKPHGVLFNGKDAAVSPWALNSTTAEKILITRKNAIPWTIFRCSVPAPLSPTFMPARTTNITDKVLQVLILLHCQVDIKTLKRIASRHMLFTPVETLAEAATVLAESSDGIGKTLNFFYDDGFDINFLRQVIDSIVNNRNIVRETFTTNCRKRGQKLLDLWLTDISPFRLLTHSTTYAAARCEQTQELLRQHGIKVPEIGVILTESIKVNVRTIEESIRTFESEDRISDALD